MQRKRLAAMVSRLAALAVVSVVVGCSGSGSGSGSAAPAKAATSAPPPLHLVVIGDSIPYNSTDDCPGCTGFVSRYAAAVKQATGRSVDIQNLSQHNGLTMPMLIDELDSFTPQLSAADIVLVGIAHNSNELASDTPCGAPRDAEENPDWAVMTPACAQASALKYRPLYDELFSKVAALRAGKPTILRTINRYDDVIGAPSLSLSSSLQAKVRTFLNTWDEMLCGSASKASFGCADIYAAFNGADGQKPSGDLLGPDYTHPSDKGNALIAQILIAQGFAPLA
jgi:lysophospholipase L1-like esterase